MNVPHEKRCPSIKLKQLNFVFVFLYLQGKRGTREERYGIGWRNNTIEYNVERKHTYYTNTLVLQHLDKTFHFHLQHKYETEEKSFNDHKYS